MSEALAEPVVEPVEPAAVEPQPAEPTLAPAASGIDYEDPQLVEFVQTQAERIADQRLQALIEEARVQAAQPQPQGPPQLVDEYGNVDPAALAAFLAQRDERLMSTLDQRLNQLAQPLYAREQAETVAEGEQRIRDMIADDIARNGDLPGDEAGKSAARELIRPLADALFPQVADTYGNSPRAAEIAVSKAAQLVRQIVTDAERSAVERHVNRNAELAGAKREPGIGASGLETAYDGLKKHGSIAAKFSAEAERIRTGG